VLQRLELELAPDSPAALRMRGERRVSADRTYENFAQTVDDRNASLTWRTRPGPGFSTEAEARVRRQEAGQQLAGTGGFTRTLIEQSGVLQIIYSPDARLRASAFAEITAARPAGGTESTRILRVGPDLGVSVGTKGRIELLARRAFVTGPPLLGLLPTADPVGPPRWEGTSRADYRVRESTTLGLTVTVRERAGRDPEVTGRGELRAFF
jgi:hypothetical protein